jgi:hypothetical protein
MRKPASLWAAIRDLINVVNDIVRRLINNELAHVAIVRLRKNRNKLRNNLGKKKDKVIDLTEGSVDLDQEDRGSKRRFDFDFANNEISETNYKSKENLIVRLEMIDIKNKFEELYKQIKQERLNTVKDLDPLIVN